MSELQIILLVLAGALLFYQAILIFWGAAMIKAGGSTRVSLMPVIFATVLAVVVVLL